MEIIGGTYYLTEKNDLCTDKGKLPIEDKFDCIQAARTIKNVDFIRTERKPDFPIGCYVNGKGVYFNTHVKGSREKSSRSICRGIGQ